MRLLYLVRQRLLLLLLLLLLMLMLLLMLVEELLGRGGGDLGKAMGLRARYLVGEILFTLT